MFITEYQAYFFIAIYLIVLVACSIAILNDTKLSNKMKALLIAIVFFIPILGLIIAIGAKAQRRFSLKHRV